MAEADLAPVTYGAYDHRHLLVTLDVDHTANVGDSFIRLNLTVPEHTGATRATLTVLTYNMAGDICAVMTDPPYQDVSLGGQVALSRDLGPVMADNPAHEAAPGISRIEINSINWFDDDWNEVFAREGDSQWSWYATINDISAPPTAVPVNG